MKENRRTKRIDDWDSWESPRGSSDWNDSAWSSPEWGSGRNKKRNVQYRFYKPMIPITAVFGGIAGVVLCLLNGKGEDLWNPFVTGCMFALFYLLLALCVHVVSRINRNWTANYDSSSGRKLITYLTAGTVFVLILGMLFEFLYELGGSMTIHEPDSYIFLIDDSGSMEANDGTFVRYDAIDDVLAGQQDDFPYMIYQFADSVAVGRSYGPISSGMGEIRKSNQGGTALVESLESLIRDFQNGVWGGSKYPRIIVLTDGDADGSRINEIIEQCVDHEIVMGTIGLGTGVDSKLLKKMAVRTGGTFVSVDQASELGEAMRKASVGLADRDLFSERDYVKNQTLYAFLRMLFLTVLGTLIGSGMYLFIANGRDLGMVAACAAVTGLVSGVLMEFGMEQTEIPANVLYILYFVLLGVTPSTAPYERKKKGRGISVDFGGGRGSDKIESSKQKSDRETHYIDVGK